MLAWGGVNRALPADRRVGHTEEGRGDLRDADASQVRGGHEPRDVADAAATERDDATVTADARLGELVPQPGRDGEPLRALPPRDAQEHVRDPDPVHRAAHRADVARGGGCVPGEPAPAAPSQT